MSTRDLLGAADVSDTQLADMVASLLHDEVESVHDVAVEPVDYDLPAITTVGRWWVSGAAATPAGEQRFRMFLKHVQAWERHPFFQLVPEEYRADAAAGIPWRTEPLVYRSDLADRLPDGLAMPRALGVFDIDELSAAVWLEEVPAPPATWDLARYGRAAHLLGRLAASRRVSPLGRLGTDFTLTWYASGRLAIQVVPMLRSDEIWRHPLCAAFDRELRDRLLTASDRALELAAEIDALPFLTCHGDACPNNLLATERDDEVVVIDFGFWGRMPVGFDLGQLLIGDVQIGKRSADTLAAVDEVIVSAYVDGLRAEGNDIGVDEVRRAHAIQLLLMSGLSSVPFDLFEKPVTADTMRIAADRAEIARYCLDLVDATALRS